MTDQEKIPPDLRQSIGMQAGAAVAALVLTISQSDAEVEVTRHAMSAGGGEASAGQITLNATLGQPVGGVSSTGDTTLSAGFWHGGLFVDVFYDSAFEEWMANLAPEDQPPADQRGPADTPAGDGVANLLKFAFGLLPLEPASGANPQVVSDEIDGFLGIEFIRSKDADVTFTVHGSTDLEAWTPLPHTQVTGTELPGLREQVRLLTGLTAADHPNYFLRLEVRTN